MAILAVDEVGLREPRLLVPGRQPVGRVKIAEPYAAPKSMCLIGKQLIRIGGSRIVYSNSSSSFEGINAGGKYLSTDGGYTIYWELDKEPFAMAGSTTWITVFSTLSTSGPDAIASEVDSATSYIEDLFVNSASESSLAGSLELTIRTPSGTLRRSYTGNIGVNDGKIHCAVWRFISTTAFDCHVDGSNRVLTDAISGTISVSAGTMEYPVWLCTRNLRNAGQFGSDATQKIYLHARLPLLVNNPAELSLNPYLLVAPA